MSTSGAENFIKQAREVQDEELEKFCLRISGFLQNQDLGNEVVDCLRRLYLIIAATKYRRKLEVDFVEYLQATLCLPKSPEQIQVLCAAILREMSPSDLVTLSSEPVLDIKLLNLVFSVLLAMGGKDNSALDVANRVAKIVEARQTEGQSPRHVLPVLSKVTTLNPASLNEDQSNIINKKLVDWLRYASIYQGTPQSSVGFFLSPRNKQPSPMTEVDGAVATDFFTVLSMGHHYTEDQWLNMHTFSMLRKWLLCYGSGGASRVESDDKSSLEGSVMSMVSATSTSSRLLPPKERLREKAYEYCQRLIEQSNRKALKKVDADLQKACLVEAITIMDIVCRQDSSYVYRALPFLKIVYGRICSDPAHSRVLLPLAQFFLHHSETAAVDSESVYRTLFTKLPAEHFHHPLLAFEFIQFCKHNAKFFTENLEVFRKSFPNIFKFLAWNSPALIVEFVELFPALLGSGTAVEFLNLLLDLPCLTAALDIQLRSVSEKVNGASQLPLANSTEAFGHSYYKSLFQYLLRRESSNEDTVEGLNSLRQVLLDMSSVPRVMHCMETVPVLLQLFLKEVVEFADGPLINQLVLVLLERSGTIYDVPKFKAEVHRELSSHLLKLCKMHPSLIIEQSRELLEFSGAATNIQNKESFFTHVVWCIGEYLSVSYDKRCTVEQINKFFEVLEALLFEITQLRPSANVPKFSPRIITVLMTTLTKLASRSQDLIPRVSLYLTKMRSCVQTPAMIAVYGEEDSEEIYIRATELMNLLKMPSVAQFVLTPSAEVSSPRFHQDTSVSLPLAMRTSSRLLQREISYIPG